MGKEMKLFCKVVGVLAAIPLFSCTGVRMTAEDGSSVTGRTVEFATPIEMSICVIPRNYSFMGKTPLGNGLSYRAKYAVLGVFCFEDLVVMDGINEKGLMCGAFYFPGFASYTPISAANQSQAISPVEFPNWVLTQFSSIAEVRQALPSIAIVPTLTKGWGSAPPPMHYIIYDKKGNSLVVEPLQGTLVSYENPIGAFTNSPEFSWHLTNLSNFLNLTPWNEAPQTLRGLSLSPFGQGSGMVGLPGDFSPPSRFVRAALFSSLAIPGQGGEALVQQTFHILNQFDIPLGVARERSGKTVWMDYTLLTGVKDPNQGRYYFRSYEDPTIRWISFADFDLNGKTVQSAKIGGKGTTVSISSSLKPLTQ